MRKQFITEYLKMVATYVLMILGSYGLTDLFLIRFYEHTWHFSAWHLISLIAFVLVGSFIGNYLNENVITLFNYYIKSITFFYRYKLSTFSILKRIAIPGLTVSIVLTLLIYNLSEDSVYFYVAYLLLLLNSAFTFTSLAVLNRLSDLERVK